MQFDLTSELQRRSFQVRCDSLLEKGSVVELTERVFRTPNQNRYLHLLLGVVAIDTGNTLEDVKREYFKRIVNPDIFISKKTDSRGVSITTYRSTTEVSREEMTLAIDRFKRWGETNGIYLPDPGEESLLREIEIEMGRMKSYL